MPNLTRHPMRTTTRTSNGFRSGLEERIAQTLLEQGVEFSYEDRVVEYLKPAKVARYTPDFNIKRGEDGSDLIIEVKGRFLTADRQKHLLVKQQHPELDIRFIFSNSKQRISKKSKTTYAMWCEKHDFKYADETIPEKWINKYG